LLGWQGPDGVLALRRRLARDLGWIRRYLLPLDCPLEHPLEDRHRLADRLAPDALSLKLGAKAGDPVGVNSRNR
jgi:hypothetical protein